MGLSQSLRSDFCVSQPITEASQCKLYTRHRHSMAHIQRLARNLENFVFQTYHLPHFQVPTRLSWYQLIGQSMKNIGTDIETEVDILGKDLVLGGRAEKLIGQMENELAFVVNGVLLERIQEARIYDNRVVKPLSTKIGLDQSAHQQLHQSIGKLQNWLAGLQLVLVPLLQQQLQLHEYTTAYLEHVLAEMQHGVKPINSSVTGDSVLKSIKTKKIPTEMDLRCFVYSDSESLHVNRICDKIDNGDQKAVQPSGDKLKCNKSSKKSYFLSPMESQYEPPSLQQQLPPCTPQQQLHPCTPQQQLHPCTPQLQLPPCTPQQQFHPCIPQPQLPPCTPQQQLPPCTPQQQLHPCTPQLQLPPCTPQQQLPPCTPQQQLHPCTPQQQLHPCTPQLQLPPCTQQQLPPCPVQVRLRSDSAKPETSQIQRNRKARPLDVSMLLCRSNRHWDQDPYSERMEKLFHKTSLKFLKEPVTKNQKTMQEPVITDQDNLQESDTKNQGTLQGRIKTSQGSVLSNVETFKKPSQQHIPQPPPNILTQKIAKLKISEAQEFMKHAKGIERDRYLMLARGNPAYFDSYSQRPGTTQLPWPSDRFKQAPLKEYYRYSDAQLSNKWHFRKVPNDQFKSSNTSYKDNTRQIKTHQEFPVFDVLSQNIALQTTRTSEAEITENIKSLYVPLYDQMPSIIEYKSKRILYPPQVQSLISQHIQQTSYPSQVQQYPCLSHVQQQFPCLPQVQQYPCLSQAQQPSYPPQVQQPSYSLKVQQPSYTPQEQSLYPPQIQQYPFHSQNQLLHKTAKFPGFIQPITKQSEHTYVVSRNGLRPDKSCNIDNQKPDSYSKYAQTLTYTGTNVVDVSTQTYELIHSNEVRTDASEINQLDAHKVSTEPISIEQKVVSRKVFGEELKTIPDPSKIHSSIFKSNNNPPKTYKNLSTTKDYRLMISKDLGMELVKSGPHDLDPYSQKPIVHAISEPIQKLQRSSSTGLPRKREPFTKDLGMELVKSGPHELDPYSQKPGIHAISEPIQKLQRSSSTGLPRKREPFTKDLGMELVKSGPHDLDPYSQKPIVHTISEPIQKLQRSSSTGLPRKREPFSKDLGMELVKSGPHDLDPYSQNYGILPNYINSDMEPKVKATLTETLDQPLLKQKGFKTYNDPYSQKNLNDLANLNIYRSNFQSSDKSSTDHLQLKPEIRIRNERNIITQQAAIEEVLKANFSSSVQVPIEVAAQAYGFKILPTNNSSSLKMETSKNIQSQKADVYFKNNASKWDSLANVEVHNKKLNIFEAECRRRRVASQ